MIPSSMARPIAAGKRAWLTSQTMPKAIATTRERHWFLPTQRRYAVGLVRSGVPGSAWGSRITWFILWSAPVLLTPISGACREGREGPHRPVVGGALHRGALSDDRRDRKGHVRVISESLRGDEDVERVALLG